MDAAIPPVPEAQLKKTDAGLIPEGEGWFVLNARDVSWIRSEERGQDTDFEGRQEWTQLGFSIHVLMPGQRNGMYHRESGQEDFLVVSGVWRLPVIALAMASRCDSGSGRPLGLGITSSPARSSA
jgi:hypothetical protein